MRIAIVTDAWTPQVNGVVRSLQSLTVELWRLGHHVVVVEPSQFQTVPLPGYSEIRLALRPDRRMAATLDAFSPEAIHIATEGPLGWSARRYCNQRLRPFTSAFHTLFPEYVRARYGVPLALGYGLLRRFHAPSAAIMVATASLERRLLGHGFERLVRWGRGVDLTQFYPRHAIKASAQWPRPVWLSVGRLAVEKNLSAFLSLDLPGTKIVVGDGPLARDLKTSYPSVVFLGTRHGEELARLYAMADVFVFPSRTDTFGLVLLEALASGLPIAAYPVQGPLDVLGGAPVGCLDDDLAVAARRALMVDPQACVAHARNFTWRRSAEQFVGHLKAAPAAAAGHYQSRTDHLSHWA